MMKLLLPKQKKIHHLFNDAAKELVNAARELNILLNDLPNASIHAQMIALSEKNADEIANSTFEYLHQTFITPFDHYDIQQITIKLDNILDAINMTAQRIVLYRLNTLPQEIIHFGQQYVELAERVSSALSMLASLKHSKQILTSCDEIGRIKTRAEETLTCGIANMFEIESDMKRLIKIRDIYVCAKLIFDNCKDFANVIKSIILEYS